MGMYDNNPHPSIMSQSVGKSSRPKSSTGVGSDGSRDGVRSRKFIVGKSAKM